MREKDGPACGLKKSDLLAAIAAGETLSSVERAWGMKYNTIHVWVKKWGLKGITTERARELLEAPAAPEESAEASEEPVKIGLLAMKDAEIEQLRQDIEQLHAELDQQIKFGAEALMENEALQKQLRAAVPSNMPSDPNSTYQALVEFGVLQPKNDDPVNHPKHYTAGGIECIDAIEAATTGLTGGQAYATGAALKYLWRWSRKNGVEDLRKARWYIDRLIGEASGE